LLRLAVAVAAPWILLHGSVYLSDSPSVDTREWYPGQTWLVLGGLSAALAADWVLLDRLAGRGVSRSVVLTLVLATLVAGVTIMLSGYASGGQLGFPSAAALFGVVLASCVLKGDLDLRGALGVAVVNLFALLLVGRFFGSLTTVNAGLLFAAPLLGWLPELLPANRAGPRVWGAARVVLATIPIAIALTLAAQKFATDSAPPSSSGGGETTIEDYLNFGK
jgi:hypothetical protein